MIFFPLGRVQIERFHQMRSNTCAQGAGVVERPPEDFQLAIFYIFSAASSKDSELNLLPALSYKFQLVATYHYAHYWCQAPEGLLIQLM